MCCELPEAALVPPRVAEMLAEYRRLQAATPVDWGGENPALPGEDYGRYLNLRRLWSMAAETGNWPEAVRRCLPEVLPCGLVVATVEATGLTMAAGPAPWVPPDPTTELGVSCTRGMEFDQATTTVTPEPGEEALVELQPTRIYDAAARGWYGGDLHVHMNYSGNLVCTPHDAALMQRGEGLHLMNLVAGNLSGARIYDREAFEHFAGQDLPWTIEGQVARWGVEFRNDMLGHFHALSPSGPPVRYQTGHERSEHPQDWPPNATACEELRGLGATVGYTHPVFSPLADGTPAGAFVNPRSVEARELVADAALGLVDSVDLLGPNDA